MGVKGIANMDLLVYRVGLRLESDVLSDGTVAEVGRRRMNSDMGEQSHDEVYGYLKSGSENSRGKRLAISMVEEAWLSEKEEV
ncbi:hypothetical protein Tco_1258190 [Tanacetum coccineum]